MTDSTLKALVIDDSPTDAQTLSYLLSKRLQTQVEIANDGLEGLDKLSADHFDLAFLDIQMPVMSGVEVLREIRGAPGTADMPVIVISSNTDPQTVRSLLELNIFDYVIKPYNAELIVKRFTEKFAPLRSRAVLPGDFLLPGEGNVREPGKPVLLIADQDANFRHFFISTLGAECHVVEAANGAQAFALALKHSPNFIFASAKLGVFNRDRMATKLRQTPNLGGLRIIAVDADGDPAPAESKLYDGHVRRTFVPQAFREAVEQILHGSAAGPVLEIAAAPLRTALISATEQVFGMMMSTEITVLDRSANVALGDAPTFGAIDLFGYGERKCLTLTFSCAQSCIVGMATRMLLMDEAEAAQNLEMAQSSLGETLNILGGRIKNSLEQQGRNFLLGLPRVVDRDAGAAARERGDTVNFAAGKKIQFAINMSTRPLTTVKVASAQLTHAMALAAPIEVDTDKRWEAATLVTAELINELKAVGFDQVEVFEPL